MHPSYKIAFNHYISRKDSASILDAEVVEPGSRPLNANEARQYKKLKGFITKDEFVTHFGMTSNGFKDDIRCRIEECLMKSIQRQK